MTSQKRFIYLTSINTSISCIGISLGEDFSSFCHQQEAECSEGFCPKMVIYFGNRFVGTVYPSPLLQGVPQSQTLAWARSQEGESPACFVNVDLVVQWDATCCGRLEMRAWEPGWHGHSLKVKTMKSAHFLSHWTSKPKLRWRWAMLGFDCAGAPASLCLPATLPTRAPWKGAVSLAPRGGPFFGQAYELL